MLKFFIMNKNFLPLRALFLLISNRKLFLLACLPGILTLLLSFLSIIFIWKLWLGGLNAWIAYPAAFLSFPILWIAFGSVALIPFEDFIVDEVQKNIWGKVRVRARDYSARRIFRELFQSLAFATILILLLPLSLIPGLNFIALLIAAWWTAWSFLSPIFNRRWDKLAEKRVAFKKYWIGNTLLGLGLNLLLFVPFANVWLIGYALILATYLEIDRHGTAN